MTNYNDGIFKEYEKLGVVLEFLRLERIGKEVAKAFGLSGEVEVKMVQGEVKGNARNTKK